MKKATCTKTGTTVAVKFYNDQDSHSQEVAIYRKLMAKDDYSSATAESNIMFRQACEQQLFLAMHDHGVTVFPWIALEFAGQSLQGAIKQRHGQLPILEILSQALTGLILLRGKGILHMDIKPCNLAWSEDRQQLKLLDYGISIVLTDVPEPPHQDEEPPWVTFLYRAPELHFWHNFTVVMSTIKWKDVLRGADLFSLGIVLFQLILGGQSYLFHNSHELRQLFLWLYGHKVQTKVSGRPRPLPRPDFCTRRLARVKHSLHSTSDELHLLGSLLCGTSKRGTCQLSKCIGGREWIEWSTRQPLHPLCTDL